MSASHHRSHVLMARQYSNSQATIAKAYGGSGSGSGSGGTNNNEKKVSQSTHNNKGSSNKRAPRPSSSPPSPVLDQLPFFPVIGMCVEASIVEGHLMGHADTSWLQELLTVALEARHNDNNINNNKTHNNNSPRHHTVATSTSPMSFHSSHTPRSSSSASSSNHNVASGRRVGPPARAMRQQAPEDDLRNLLADGDDDEQDHDGYNPHNRQHYLDGDDDDDEPMPQVAGKSRLARRLIDAGAQNATPHPLSAGSTGRESSSGSVRLAPLRGGGGAAAAAPPVSTERGMRSLAAQQSCTQLKHDVQFWTNRMRLLRAEVERQQARQERASMVRERTELSTFVSLSVKEQLEEERRRHEELLKEKITTIRQKKAEHKVALRAALKRVRDERVEKSQLSKLEGSNHTRIIESHKYDVLVRNIEKKERIQQEKVLALLKRIKDRARHDAEVQLNYEVRTQNVLENERTYKQQVADLVHQSAELVQRLRVYQDENVAEEDKIEAIRASAKHVVSSEVEDDVGCDERDHNPTRRNVLRRASDATSSTSRRQQQQHM